MPLSLKLWFFYSVLLQSSTYVVSRSLNSSNSVCIQAIATPTAKTLCVPLQHNTYCKKKGIPLDQFVFASSNTQMENDNKLNQFQDNLNNFRLFFSLSEKCAKAVDIVYCHYYFPRCDSTTHLYKEQKLCRETCQYFTNTCSHELQLLKFLPTSSSLDLINCETFSLRNAGESPECYFFDRGVGEKGQLNDQVTKHEEDCLHENGRAYQGTVSVTSSGIPCQPWTVQCPHRHTMVSTYPQLKNASNYCRNSRGSGQRPWCFTSDKDKRWEYCDIPKCSPGIPLVKTASVVPAKITTTIKTVLPTMLTRTTTTKITVSATKARIPGEIGSSSTVLTASKTISFTSTPAMLPSTKATHKITLSTKASIPGEIGPSSTVLTASKTLLPTTTTTTTTRAIFPTKITPIYNTTNSVCIPAEPLPNVTYPCTYLSESYGAYCKNHGVKLDSYVFKNSWEQSTGSENLIRFETAVKLIGPFVHTIQVSKRCLQIVRRVYCRHYFPTCDRTGRQVLEQKLCKETCDFLKKSCKKELMVAERLNNNVNLFNTWQYSWEILNCTTFPMREAGSSPECWYYEGAGFNKTNSSQPDFQNDCVYREGRAYQGNISVTSSGVPCQPWTVQCPHRHTMVSTYPELKNASNHCRNPRGSGQLPWCFTSDKDKRWEYCHIPNCLSVNGGYGNWTLRRRCNSACGQGVEEWGRVCDSPAPKYDGNNCSSLGNATEYRNCSYLPPCPINGNYGEWMQNSTCNVTCGNGFEMWIRKCDNPTPAYGGHSCLVLGEAEKWESCQTILCVKSPAIGSHTLKIAIGAAAAPVALVIIVISAILGYRRMKRQYEPYATLHFDKIISTPPTRKPEDSAKPNVTTVPPQTYANLTENGAPLPGLCTGIVPYQEPYVNTTSLNKPHYSKLQLFSSITMDWLRNTWGQVDELGAHVYDAMHRGIELLSLYDKPKIKHDNSARDHLGAVDENGAASYDQIFVRRPAMPKARVHRSPSEEKDETKVEENSLNGENPVV